MNPSNQPEPKQNITKIVWGSGHLGGVDAQAEVGLRGVISEILVKWGMPTRQAAINEIMAATQAERDAAVREAALVNADLAWCLGKLRGLGNPAEHLEQKYQLARLQPPTAMTEAISLCPICYVMTHTVSAEFEEQCGKCGGDKTLGKNQPPTAGEGESVAA